MKHIGAALNASASSGSSVTAQTAQERCPCCDGYVFYEVVAFPGVPATGVYRATAHEPLPTIDLSFEACQGCSLLRRRSVADPVDYANKQRSTRGQLPAYRENLLQAIAQFVPRPNDLVVEIGSNDGTFLELLRERGYSNLLGIEPARELAETSRKKGLRIECGYFGEEMAKRVLDLYGSPSAAVCRHTLEHVPRPADFVDAIRELIRPAAGEVLIEVPDSEVIYDGMNFMELWDEHVYYFTPVTLSLLLESSGLNIQSRETFSHLETRNIVICASVKRSPQDAPSASAPIRAPDWKAFSKRLGRLGSSLRDVIATAPKPVYVIGASHPQCNFINFLALDSMVQFMIDDDPAKLGKVPPVRGEPVHIISSTQFMSCPEAGTMILTGFGYPAWTMRMTAAASAKSMRIVDPRDFMR